MTELAYLADLPSAYVRTFQARITALPPGAVVLDRTFFYPTGGGQPADRGTLVVGDAARVEVVDVTKSGPSVVHRVRGPPESVRALAAGAEVDATIDWTRRYRHMRLHTGQHLLSARIFARFGVKTRRANLADRSATLDLERGLPNDALTSLAADLEEAAHRPRPVVIRFVPRREWDANPFAERSGLVPLPPQVDPVRVVEIEAADVCPCGGTHVRSTREIGALTLAAPTPLPAGARIGFSLDDPDAPTPSG